MGDRLAQLIAEGRRALGKEVVVMSEAAEDAEDDMSGNWEEVDNPAAPISRSRSRPGSIRRKQRPTNVGIPSAYASTSLSSANTSSTVPPLMSAPGYQNQFSIPIPSHQQPHPYVRNDILGHGRSQSEEVISNSPAMAGNGLIEDPSMWHSPELRESMERARARYLQNRR
jgi:hypothetical protein